MKKRKKELGNKNIIGVKVRKIRMSLGMKQQDLLTKMQIKGIDIHNSGLSKLESQTRRVNDYEIKVIAEILNVSVNELLEIKEK